MLVSPKAVSPHHARMHFDPLAPSAMEDWEWDACLRFSKGVPQ